MAFKPATKKACKARIALMGPSGAGKTFSALMLAFALGETVAVIDTESGSASKYVGVNGWEFLVDEPSSYSPLSLIDKLAEAAGAGVDTIIIDSLSHYWMGTDGMLEQVDRRSGANKFTSGWKEVGPEERKMLAALLAYPGHVIVTFRVKTEYVIEENERGRKEPKRVGLKPVQRDGIEYEFDLIGDMDRDNNLTVGKSRIQTVKPGTLINKPGVELARSILEFCAEGAQGPTVADLKDRALRCDSVDELKALFEEARAHRLDGAPMLDNNGNPTLLGEFLRNRASLVRADVAATTGAGER